MPDLLQGIFTSLEVKTVNSTQQVLPSRPEFVLSRCVAQLYLPDTAAAER